MKKLLILVMAISLFAACNNDKGNKKADYREKDDYSNTDEKNKDEQGDDKSKKDDNQGDFNSGDGWSERDKTSFLSECMTGFANNQDIGKKICPCALVKFEKNYSSFAEANKAPESEGNKIGKQCMQELNINSNNNTDDGDYASGGWSSREVKEFVSGCMREAMRSGMEELDAQSYCDCMQYKIAGIYPNYADANSLTAADLKTSAMKKMIQSCLPGN